MKKLKQSLNEMTPKSVIGNGDIVDEQQKLWIHNSHSNVLLRASNLRTPKWKKTFSFYLHLI